MVCRRLSGASASAQRGGGAGTGPEGLDGAGEDPRPALGAGGRGAPLPQTQVHHVEHMAAHFLAAVMQATDGGVDILPAPRKSGKVEEPQQLLDIRLDVAVHGRQGFVGIVHGWALWRKCRIHFPGSGGWFRVASLFKLRR